ncbi:MAG: tetratricopeptide repeat protein, partial [Saprospiraceae bacterium]|nr:tetratricopeptide repeat protein [Saprospiraceae bacterium]
MKIDSLKAVLNRYPREDTVRARLLIELSNALIKVDSKEGLVSSDKALEILAKHPVNELKADAFYAKAEHLKDMSKRTEAFELANQALNIYEPLRRFKKMAHVHLLLSNIYAGRTDTENGKKQCELAIALAEKIGDVKIKIDALNAISVVFMGGSDYKSGVPYSEQAADLAHKSGEKKGEAIALGNLGFCHFNLGNYTTAIDCQQKASRINENIGNDYNLAYNCRNLGSIYIALRDPEKALPYYKRGLSLAAKVGQEPLEAELYVMIGNSYKDMKLYDEAIQSIKKGMAINEKKGRNPHWGQLGLVYQASGQLLEAHRCFQEAVIESKKSNRPGNLAAVLIEIGRIYTSASDSLLTKMGVNPSERYSKALAIVLEALETTKQMRTPQRTVKALEVLSLIYEKNKDYTKAYDTYKEYITLKDSIRGDEVKEQITRKEIQYEFDKKETELKYQQQLTQGELEKQRLLTAQREQDLLLNRQNLTLKEQALALSNREKDLAHLAYLKEQAEKQEKAQQLSLSEEREKGKERDLSLKNLELSAQQKQNLYLGLLAAVLLGGLGVLSYFYTALKKKNTIIAQQNELNEHTIAILSHDIKEPLLGVKLMLKKLNTNDPFVAQASQSLEGQINSVNGILTNLLKMKKLSLVKKDKNTQANVQAVVKNVLQELNVAIQTKELTIQNDITEGLVLPIAPEKLQIIVHNLLSNAVKYSFPNQKIRIFNEGKGFCIQDFGVGLSPEQRSKLMREVTASQRGT